MPTPRGLSQAPTSLIGSWCQDIHRLPLVACHKNKQQKTKLRYKEMLASTIQFSKYGQENQPRTTTHHQTRPDRETTHPSKRTHQQFGESRPQPPTTPTQRQCDCDPEKPVHVSNETRPDFSGPNSAPRPFTLRRSTFHTHKWVVLASLLEILA